MVCIRRLHVHVASVVHACRQKRLGRGLRFAFETTPALLATCMGSSIPPYSALCAPGLFVLLDDIHLIYTMGMMYVILYAGVGQAMRWGTICMGTRISSVQVWLDTLGR